MSYAHRLSDPSLNFAIMASRQNKVFIATSMDGYIADKEGKIDFLDIIPEINNIDSGYAAFMADIDAMIMGRSTYETVCGFDIDWPYNIPVYVLSKTLVSGSLKFDKHVSYLKGEPNEILNSIHSAGHHNLYIDGGSVIQSFLKDDLIDEMIITTIPVILGAGAPLFGETEKLLKFNCVETKHYLNSIVQNRYLRIR